VRDVLPSAAAIYAGLWIATLVGAAAGVLVGGAAPGGGRSAGISLFASALGTNARLLAVLALAALLVAALPAWRPVLDAVVGALALVNPIAVGAALGAGGPDVALAVPQLPFEWAALAGGLALYVRARRRSLAARTWIQAGGAVVALLVLAAGVEAWAPELG
jgi:hypothetical protein